MLRSVLSPFALGIAVVILNPSDVVAQNCKVCDNVWEDDVWQHHFHASTCTTGSYCYDCEIFNSCHANFQPAQCDAYHWHCGIQEEDLDAALAAGEKLDVGTLYALASNEPSAFQLNIERSVFQILNCRGAVVAQFSIDVETLATLDP